MPLPPRRTSPSREPVSVADAQIDRVEGTWSNSPPLYQIYYHEGSGKKGSGEYRYSDHRNLSGFQIYPPEVKAAMNRGR